MRTEEMKYNDISETIELIKIQVADSKQFARQWLSFHAFNTPQEMFYLLKDQLYFQSDPEGVEYLQTMQTMFRNDPNGEGFGDCDCFVITATCLSLLCGWKTEIVLAGREQTTPTHIYNIVEGYLFDLTQSRFNTERNYPYKQYLKVSPQLLNIDPKRYLIQILKKRG